MRKSDSRSTKCGMLDRSSGGERVERMVQNETVASLEARSTVRGTGSIERWSSRLYRILFWSEFFVQSLNKCITSLFNVMFIVMCITMVINIVEQGVTCEFMVIYEGILRVMNTLPINRIHHSQKHSPQTHILRVVQYIVRNLRGFLLFSSICDLERLFSR